MTYDKGIITSFRNVTKNPQQAFFSLEGKDINASDPEWWKYSDKVTIPEGVELTRMSHYYQYYQKSDFMKKLYDDSEISQAS